MSPYMNQHGLRAFRLTLLLDEVMTLVPVATQLRKPADAQRRAWGDDNLFGVDLRSGLVEPRLSFSLRVERRDDSLC